MLSVVDHVLCAQFTPLTRRDCLDAATPKPKMATFLDSLSLNERNGGNNDVCKSVYLPDMSVMPLEALLLMQSTELQTETKKL